MYEVYECEKPACIEGFPDLTKECWANNKFKTIEEAREYVGIWLGQYEVLLDHDLEIDEPCYYGVGGDYVVIHQTEDIPKLLQPILKDLDVKRVSALKVTRIAKILEAVAKTIPKELAAYPEIYYHWHGYRGKLQVNGIENMKTQIPPIITEFAKFGYKVLKYDDSAQSALRTYYLCLRDAEDVQDIYISAYLAQNNAQCHYVQVGTRTKEEPIYELRCDDPVAPKPESDDGSGEPLESGMSSGKQRESEGVPQDGTKRGDSADPPDLCEGLQPDCRLPEVDTEG